MTGGGGEGGCKAGRVKEVDFYINVKLLKISMLGTKMIRGVFLRNSSPLMGAWS